MEIVERYRTPTRVLHWVHGGAFVLLFLTGLVLFVPPLAFLAQGSWTRVIHRAAAVLFIAAPVLYLVLRPGTVLRSMKEAFTWGAEDLGWLQAAPRYYFLGDEKAMPPQGHMNSGQKLWWFMVIIFSILFIVTGLVMWVFKTTAPAAALQWAVFAHDVAFIATGAMFFVHVYLSAFHPLMAESWNSMAGRGVSVEYARSHHARWYEEISRHKTKREGKVRVS
ncbi:MAG: cytochrome b/b6 domain-containing protein [Chloroflexi bacterium]|nr:cytochrome b/b6 domain-containing protein [Chloroflexota bacterium]